MKAKDAFSEVAAEFGWGAHGWPPGRPLGIPDLGWPGGWQVDLSKVVKRGVLFGSCGEERLIAYFPDTEPWLIRIGDIRVWDMHAEYEWPDGAGVDFDLRDPESIKDLRTWIQDYSRHYGFWDRARRFFTGKVAQGSQGNDFYK